MVENEYIHSNQVKNKEINGIQFVLKGVFSEEKFTKQNLFKGEITVMFSLLLLLILSLFFTMVESARVSSNRAVITGITELGGFSLQAEYRRELLEEYELFFLDAGFGSGDLRIDGLEEILVGYMEYNIPPYGDRAIDKGIDLLKAKPVDCHIDEYILATDQGGEPFKRQITEYMKAVWAIDAAEKILNMITDTENYEKWQEDYQNTEKDNTEILEQLEKEIEENGQEYDEAEQPEDVKDPRKSIGEIKKKGILSLVMKDPESVSKAEVNLSDMVSVRDLIKGNGEMKKEQENSPLDKVLRAEYIMDKFTSVLKNSTIGGLEYQIEYILQGKGSDADNLKGIVHKLLLCREGSNFLYLMSSTAKKAEAYGLAATITAAFPVPGLTKATQLALLLAWAYAESLIDVRILLDGKKVPFLKNDSTWNLSLENLGNVMEILNGDTSNHNNGMNYHDYIRIFLYAADENLTIMRCMDMVENKIRDSYNVADFRMDHCIDWYKVRVRWEMELLFSRFIFLPLDSKKTSYYIENSFAYGYGWGA